MLLLIFQYTIYLYNILILIFQQKYLKRTIALHFPELLPKKTAKYGPKIEFTSKHRMFSLIVYPSSVTMFATKNV